MTETSENNTNRLPLEKRWVAISALSGLLLGLTVAWFIWHKVPPPHKQTAKVEIAPASGPIEAPAPAAANRVVKQPAAESVEPQLPVGEINLEKAVATNGRMVIELDGKREVTLTLMPQVQKRATQVLKRAEVPYGALIAMEPSTGRLLSYVEHSTANPELQNLAGLANPPAASVFKVITTAALLETTRVTPEFKTCFYGGHQGISKRHLEDNPQRDSRCQSLTEALGKSTNAIYGKLAYRKLTPDTLKKYATNFGWGRDIPFIFPVQKSRANFSDDRVELARTAAGFYNTHLSPIHAVMVAGAVANEGRMMAPGLVEHYTVNGRVIIEHSPQPMGRAIRQHTARTLARMMVHTTESGTSGPYFRKRAKSLKGIDVAGKTGSLSAMADDGTRHQFSWWVGFAPADNPRIAVAALVVNIGKWRIKSSYLARESLEAYFDAIMKDQVTGK